MLPPSRPLRLEYLRAFGWQARGGSAGMVSRSVTVHSHRGVSGFFALSSHEYRKYRSDARRTSGCTGKHLGSASVRAAATACSAAPRKPPKSLANQRQIRERWRTRPSAVQCTPLVGLRQNWRMRSCICSARRSPVNAAVARLGHDAEAHTMHA